MQPGQAQALSLTVADAFNVAYELYEESKKQKENRFEEKEQLGVKVFCSALS